MVHGCSFLSEHSKVAPFCASNVRLETRSQMSSVEARLDEHTPSEIIGSAAEPSCRVVQGCRGKRLVQIPQYGKEERWKTRKTLRRSAQVRLHQGTFMIRECRHPVSDGPL